MIFHRRYFLLARWNVPPTWQIWGKKINLEVNVSSAAVESLLRLVV